MSTATPTEELKPETESDDSKRYRLSDEVRLLASLKVDESDIKKQIDDTCNRIYRLAVDDLKLIPKPPRYGAAEQFSSDGFVVTVGPKECESSVPKVTLTEFGHLPKV